ncbi:unnamed protein product [Mytilus coruscus]|uniref:Uncharacterized protein n=1 Tax=Mytilus coruscus TaxID=42192 RepID=A0A6J8ECQ9_MYTCO|nr:unnamed protein product [Mytilus coruscus]
MVKYFLDECDPDVEQKGLFKIHSSENDIEAPPLWCTTGLENGFDIIKLLIEHGTDINWPTSAQSAPLISASGLLNIPIVEFLVEHGADIRKITERGYSCLMATIASTELCAYLISKGASVNISSIDGYTALHYAAHAIKLETVILLCRNGGSMTAKTNYQETPLKIAAIRGMEEKCDAFDLLGCSLVDDDVTQCVLMWETALTLRFVVANSMTDPVQMTDVFDVFKLIVSQIDGGKSVRTIHPIGIIEQANFQCFKKKLTLHLIRLFQFLGGSVNDRLDFLEQVKYLVQLDPRGINNQTLLHLAVDPNISKEGDISLMKFPSVYVVDILLVCGANTNIRNDDGYDPLRNSIKFSDLPPEKV